jgi:hypothetical protein
LNPEGWLAPLFSSSWDFQEGDSASEPELYGRRSRQRRVSFPVSLFLA